MDNTAEPRPEPSDYRFRRLNLLMILLVIAILGVLSVMLLPTMGPGPVPSTEACANNLSRLYKAMHVYVSAFGKNRNYMPHTGDAFFTCLLGHTGSEHPFSYVNKAPCYGNLSLYVCPSRGSNDSSVTPGGAMADYLGPARHPAVPVGNPSALVDGVFSRYPIACDAPGNHKGGGNVLWFDGCVTFLRGQDYEAAVKACSD